MEKTLCRASEDLVRAGKMMSEDGKGCRKEIGNILYDIGFSILIKGEVCLHLKGNKKQVRTVVKSLAIIINAVAKKHNLREFFRNHMKIGVDFSG